MAAAANPLASQAGRAVLRQGGSGVDAAIAMQAVLTLVEPQATGIGGGAFLMVWDGRQAHAYDGRETAPAGATETLFLRADGKPMEFNEARIGGRSVGVPGVLRMLELAHRAYGRLPWAQFFEPAIRLAEQGFSISARLQHQKILLCSSVSDSLKFPFVSSTSFLETAHGGPMCSKPLALRT